MKCNEMLSIKFLYFAFDGEHEIVAMRRNDDQHLLVGAAAALYIVMARRASPIRRSWLCAPAVEPAAWHRHRRAPFKHRERCLRPTLRRDRQRHAASGCFVGDEICIAML